MSSGMAFPAKVVIFFSITFGVAVWFLNGGPIPMVTVTAVEPSDHLPTFTEVAAPLEATGDSEAQLDMDFAVQSMSAAATVYSLQNCNSLIRLQLVDGIENYFKTRRSNPNLPIVLGAVLLPGGKTLLDEAKINALLQKLFQRGLLILEEFSPQTRSTLAGLVSPGTAEDQQHYKDCQAQG